MKNYYYLKNPQNKVSSIDIIVSIKGKYLKIPTGESLPVNCWNNASKCARVNKKFPDGLELNDRLDKLNEKVNKAINKAKESKILPDRETFKKWIFEDDIETEVNNNSLVDYINNYIDRVSMAKNTKKKYVTCINKLIEYEKFKGERILFENVNIHFYEDLKKWFYSLIKPIPKSRFINEIEELEIDEAIENFSKNYFGSLIKIIKKCMRSSLEDGLHNYNGFLHSEFKVDAEPIDSIYLNEYELNKLFKLRIDDSSILKAFPKLTPTNLNRKIESYKNARNYFLIGAYTGLRVSDFTRLEEVNFDDKYLRIKTKKTNQPVIIPLHPIVKEIIKEHNFNKRISEQKINQQIKLVAKLAEINNLIEITKSQGNKTVRKVYKKYQLITTHTARRSCATNMYIAGIPAQSIMKITGHKTESSFLKYLRISLEENAELLAKHDFYKTKN